MAERFSLQSVPFIQELDRITTKIENLQKKVRQNTNSITDQEVHDLMTALQKYQDLIDTDLLENKKLILAQGQEIDARIEHALEAILSVRRTKPVSHKDVDEMIASLSPALLQEMNKFENTVKNLRDKWKAVHQKVQEAGRSKET